MLGYPFDEVVKLLDEVADLPTKSQRYSSEAETLTNIVTAEVETWGPRKYHWERLSESTSQNPFQRENENLTHLSNLSLSARTSQTPFIITLRSCSLSACIGTLSSRSTIWGRGRISI